MLLSNDILLSNSTPRTKTWQNSNQELGSILGYYMWSLAAISCQQSRYSETVHNLTKDFNHADLK